MNFFSSRFACIQNLCVWCGAVVCVNCINVQPIIALLDRFFYQTVRVCPITSNRKKKDIYHFNIIITYIYAQYVIMIWYADCSYLEHNILLYCYLSRCRESRDFKNSLSERMMHYNINHNFPFVCPISTHSY